MVHQQGAFIGLAGHGAIEVYLAVPAGGQHLGQFAVTFGGQVIAQRFAPGRVTNQRQPRLLQGQLHRVERVTGDGAGRSGAQDGAKNDQHQGQPGQREQHPSPDWQPGRGAARCSLQRRRLLQKRLA